MADTFDYTATHVSALDGSPAMRVVEANGRITLVNEDGYVWTDPSGQWRLIEGTKTCSHCGATLVNEDCPSYGNGPEHR